MIPVEMHQDMFIKQAWKMTLRNGFYNINNQFFYPNVVYPDVLVIQRNCTPYVYFTQEEKYPKI